MNHRGQDCPLPFLTAATDVRLLTKKSIEAMSCAASVHDRRRNVNRHSGDTVIRPTVNDIHPRTAAWPPGSATATTPPHIGNNPDEVTHL